jgi:hypothetical protein
MVYKLKPGYRSALIEVLQELFPKISDLNTFIEVDLNLSDKPENVAGIAGNLRESMNNFVNYFNKNKSIFFLIEELKEKKKDSEFLKDFITKFTEEEKNSFISKDGEYTIRNGIPMINRGEFCQNLRSVVANNSKGVFIVSGPECSGKSHSYVYFNHICKEQNPESHVILVDMGFSPFGFAGEKNQSMILAKEIVGRLNFLPQESMPILKESDQAAAQAKTDTRWRADFFNWVMRNMREKSATCWVVLDGLSKTHITSETKKFIAEMALRATTDLEGFFLVLIEGSVDEINNLGPRRFLINQDTTSLITQDHWIKFFNFLYLSIEPDITKRNNIVADSYQKIIAAAPESDPRRLDRMVEALIPMMRDAMSKVGT